MHPISVRFHWWEVPYRIIWPEFESFITGGPTGTDNTVVPQVSVGESPKKGLLDYMGVPPVANMPVSALPVRAYNKIFNENYRDQDLVAEVPEDTVNIQRICWEKDYFSGARPWPQKGPEVTIGLGTQAPISGLGAATTMNYALTNTVVREKGKEVTYPTGVGIFGGAANQTAYMRQDAANAGFPDVYADLSEAGAVSINDLRTAFALQRFQEARARWGSRYTEYLRYIGIKSSDHRLNRPNYLGGGKSTISFSEVLQTADDTTNQNPLGRLGGHGITALRTRPFRRFFEEHCVVMCLMSVRPRTMYTNSLAKMWLKQNKEDYFQRELAHVGQQPIVHREIYAGTSNPTGTFGWADRYAEYKSEPSKVVSEMRDLLNYWHLSREFSEPPALNQSFVECQPSKRIHAVQTNDTLWGMVAHSIRARRQVPKAGFSTVR